ncbi:MAG: ABC transporter substrate-binding protein [Actinomycetia bacterium]|nr:ABC transporter substrate-binding protein [Actinomycetes bacterium]
MEGCQAETRGGDGIVRVFATVDRAGTAGDIGPSMVRIFELWFDKVNAEGGIIGCQIEADVIDEPFPDLDACLRNWRDAIGSGKYDFYFGAFNSACQAAVPELTNAAGQVVIANSAADHLPHFEKFQRLNIHGAVSTFLEGRSMAVFAKQQGWKRIATLAPNYAYGQDAERGFTEYFRQIVPDGEIVTQQFPEFDEDNFTTFINAIAGEEPDALISTFFGPFVVPFWKQWDAAGLSDTPNIGGILDTPTFEVVASADEIPANSHGYDRGYWGLLVQTPLGKEVYDLYVANYGDDPDHPIPSAWTFPYVSGIEMAIALAEETGGFDPDAWIERIEQGDFTFNSPYHKGPTPVNPINHMADTCAQVAPVFWNEELPVKADFDLNGLVNVCMHDILPDDEARALTDNPRVTDEALARYNQKIEEVKAANGPGWSVGP